MSDYAVLIFILALLGSLWLIAFINQDKRKGKEGRLFFLKHFGLFVGVNVVVFLIVVVPSLDCKGWFCGIVEVLIFLAFAGLSSLIWSIWLIVANKKEPEDDIIS